MGGRIGAREERETERDGICHQPPQSPDEVHESKKDVNVIQFQKLDKHWS